MAPIKNRICDVEGCGRKHAAGGLCLMHYKRLKKHGTLDYTWGGKPVGLSCEHCDRPAVAKNLCMRHYQMLRNHGDPLYADKKKVGGLPHGEHHRRGYKMVSPVADYHVAEVAGPSVEKSDRHFYKGVEPLGLRDGSKRSRRQWEHRKVAGAKPGQIVHHIDGDKLNNTLSNLHVFDSAAAHGRAHRSLEKIAYWLLEAGLAEFDRVEGIYKLRPGASLTIEI